MFKAKAVKAAERPIVLHYVKSVWGEGADKQGFWLGKAFYGECGRKFEGLYSHGGIKGRDLRRLDTTLTGFSSRQAVPWIRLS